MKTLNATQQALIDATYKTVSWFFEVSNVYIDYDAKPSDAKFTVGNSLYQMVDGAVTAQGTIEKHERFTQTTGRLHLSGILGSFVDDYPVYEASYGSELITAQNDRDFSSGTIGNWEVETGGSGTLVYDGVNPGAEQVGKLTSAGDDNVLKGNLNSDDFGALEENCFYKLSASCYVPAANTLKTVMVYLENYLCIF